MEANDPNGKWAFTFGHGQYGGKLKNKYVIFLGTHREARDQMNRAFGTKWANKWAFQYAFDAEFEKQIATYGLEEV